MPLLLCDLPCNSPGPECQSEMWVHAAEDVRPRGMGVLYGAQIKTLDPATHAYSFWEGVPETSRRAFGRLFRASKSLQVPPAGPC